MIYSQQAETEKLIYRFMWGELPLFACEQWLQEPETISQLPEKLQIAMKDLDLSDLNSMQRRQEIERLFDIVVDPRQFQTWLLLELLPLVMHEDPRACLALAQISELYQDGLHFLQIMELAFQSGAGAAHFDWNRVRDAVPHLKPVCRLLIQALSNGEITMNQSGVNVSNDLAGLLVQKKDWRQANHEILRWEQAQNQLIPSSLGLTAPTE